MMQYNNFRRTTSPWRANAMTLVALVSITFWSAQQRPNSAAPQFSQSSASLNTSVSAQVQPKTVASTVAPATTATATDAPSITTASLSSTSLEASGLHQVGYNPALYQAAAVKR